MFVLSLLINEAVCFSEISRHYTVQIAKVMNLLKWYPTFGYEILVYLKRKQNLEIQI